MSTASNAPGLLVALLLAFVAWSFPASAASPAYSLGYGGRVTDSAGAPVAGPVDLEVAFFRSAGGGEPVLGAPLVFPKTSLANGVFQLALTLSASDFATVFADVSQAVFVQVTDTTHAVVYPRQQFLMVPFAAKVPVDGSTIAYDGGGQLTLVHPPGTAANSLVQLDASSRLPAVDGSQLTGVVAATFTSPLAGDVTGGQTSTVVSKLQGQPVVAIGATSGQFLQWNGTAWSPGSVSGTNGGTVTSVGATSPLTLAGGATTAPVLGITQAGSGGDGYLSQADWTTFNGKQPLITGSSAVNGGTFTTAAQDGLELKHYGAGSGQTGELRFDPLAGGTYVGFKAPDAVTTAKIWTLPAADGTSGQALTTNGGGVLTFATVNLGTGVTGTLASGAFPATLPAVSGANLTSLNASQLTSGTLATSVFPTVLPAVSGANVTNLNAGAVTSGTLAVALGGTGATSWPNDALLVGGGLSITALPAGSQGNVLVGGSGGAPDWGQVNLSSAAAVFGTLPAANGGTGSNAALGGNRLIVSSGAAFVEAPGLSVVSGNVGVGTTSAGSALDLAGALSQRGMVAPGVAPVGQGRVYFDASANQFLVSQNGGAYTALVTGSLAATQLSGTLAVTALPSLPAGLITGSLAATQLTGTLAVSALPALPASLVTGSLAVGQISGTLAAAQIPPLSAGQIASGTLAAAVVPWSTPGTIGSLSPSTGVFTTLVASGNVGIGTTAPGTSLDVAGALTERATTAPVVAPAGQGRIYFDASANAFLVSQNGGAYAPLATGATYAGVTAGPGLTGGVASGSVTLALPAVGAATTYTKILTDAYGRVTAGTSLASADLPPVPTSLLTGTLASTQVGSIPATQLTGTLAGPQVGTLAASQITSGTLALAQVPLLPASQVTSGTIASAQIPFLPASQITSGTFAIADVPSLPASQITSGTLANTLVNWASPGAIGVTTASTGAFAALTTTGSVGIGTTSPAQRLDVNGHLQIESNYDLTWPQLNWWLGPGAGNGDANLQLYNTAANVYALSINAAGNVGISTTSPSSTLQVNGSIATAVASHTSTYTLGTGDSFVTANATSGAFTVTLPDATTMPGREYTIKKTDSSTNAVTVATTSSQTIDGATTFALAVQWQYVSVLSDGSNWIIASASRSVQAATAFSGNTSYTAASDGLVTATGWSTSGRCYLEGVVDGVVITFGDQASATYWATTTFPVQKGHSYQVATSGCSGTLTLNFWGIR